MSKLSDMQWARISKSKQKRVAYEVDLHFRVAWAALSDTFESLGSDPLVALHDVALLVIKPDAYPARAALPMIDLLAKRGWAVSTWWQLQINAHSMRELWRFDWDVYTEDRILMSELMYARDATVLVLLRRASRGESRIPASVQLSLDKGASAPHARSNDSIRAMLCAPNSVINYIHTGDEPADVVRELGLFLPAKSIREWCSRSALPVTDDSWLSLRSHVQRLTERTEQNDFVAEAALTRLVRKGVMSGELAEATEGAMKHHKPLPWSAFECGIDWQKATQSTWDIVAVCIETIALERDGHGALLPPPRMYDW